MSDTNKKIIKKLYEGYLLDYDKNKDYASLDKLYNMIKKGEIKLSAIDVETAAFLPYNKGSGSCNRCNLVIGRGNPIFIQQDIRWCVACSTDEEKKNSYYLRYLKKQNPIVSTEVEMEDFE